MKAIWSKKISHLSQSFRLLKNLLKKLFKNLSMMFRESFSTIFTSSSKKHSIMLFESFSMILTSSSKKYSMMFNESFSTMFKKSLSTMFKSSSKKHSQSKIQIQNNYFVLILSRRLQTKMTMSNVLLICQKAKRRRYKN